MKLGVRTDPDQGRTRTIDWAGGSSSDVGVLVLFGVAIAVLAASVATLIFASGGVRAVSVVVALMAGMYAGVMVVGALISSVFLRRLMRLVGRGNGK